MLKRKLRVEGLQDTYFDKQGLKEIADFMEMDLCTTGEVVRNEVLSKRYSESDINMIRNGKKAGTLPINLNLFKGESKYQIMGWLVTYKEVSDEPLVS